jgi:hypothetical protein
MGAILSDYSIQDGFKFRNDINFAVCGGMSFASLDYYYDPIRRVPPQTSIPAIMSPLWCYLGFRQKDSLWAYFDIPVKIFSWMCCTETDLKNKTKSEFDRLRFQINSYKKPVALCLIRFLGLAPITKNHQVVAYGYEDCDGNNSTKIYTYDPNHVPPYSPTITVYKSGGGTNYSISKMTESSRPLPLYGFFINGNYKFKTPP